MNELFGQSYSSSDRSWVLKGYFDRMYHDGNFIKSLELLVKGRGFSTDGAYCNFLGLENLFEEEQLKVLSLLMAILLKKKILVVSNEVFSNNIRLACEKYIGIHPEDAVKVECILNQLSFSEKPSDGDRQIFPEDGLAAHKAASESLIFKHVEKTEI